MALFGNVLKGDAESGGTSYVGGSPTAYGDSGSSPGSESLQSFVRAGLLRRYNQQVAALQQSSNFHMPAFHMPAFHFPEFPTQPSGPSYAELMAEQERIQGLNQRDELYSSYLTAASSATDYVNNQILQEQANARLLGIDYAIDDELKSQRISDYFASIWGEGEQLQLETLMGRYGNPEGFEGFTLQRGDGSKYAGQREGSEKSIATSKGARPRTILEGEEEEGTLAPPQSILGV
jgi:hypothetical protein